MPPTAGFRLTIDLPRAEAELLGERLEQTLDPPPGAVSMFEHGQDLWRLECFFPRRPDESAISAIIRDTGPAAAPQPVLEQIEAQDWAAKSQAMLHPVRAGRFLIHGSHDRDRLPPSRWRMEIDAGQAFGTAHHGSTLGCLEMLGWLGNRGVATNVLDVGTGSGILAIAAARLWHSRTLATDIDPLAISVARGNARRNGAPDIRFAVAAGLAGPAIRAGAPYELVCANILARPLTGMAAGLSRLVEPDGYVLLSGITGDQAPWVAAAYGAAGFARARELRRGPWTTLLMRRRN